MKIWVVYRLSWSYDNPHADCVELEKGFRTELDAVAYVDACNEADVEGLFSYDDIDVVN